MLRLLALPTALALALTLAIGPARASDERKREAPARDQWISDVRAVMRGSHAYVRDRIAAKSPDENLAVNFDIDNTVIATYYDGGGAIPRMLRLARFLEGQGVAVLFNTGRLGDQRRRTVRQLERNGFPVDGLCLRGRGRPLAFGKQRCRDLFIARGYTLIANVGNNDTDFEGDGYERAFVLPNYGGVLG